MLNCDLGEGLDAVDQQVMPHIDYANIACGGHAGSDASMIRVIALAKRHQKTIGAHPSYPDTKNFGRTSLDIPLQDLRQSIEQQIQALRIHCEAANIRLSYIKPHGALYNDLATRPDLLQMMVDMAHTAQIPLMLQAFPNPSPFSSLESTQDVLFEAFADRAYSPNGALIPRSQSGAVHQDIPTIVSQVKSLLKKQCIPLDNGKLQLNTIHSLCFHGDHPLCVLALTKTRALMQQ